MDHQSSLSVLCLGALGWQKAINEKMTIDEAFRSFVGQIGQSTSEIIKEANPRPIHVPDTKLVELVVTRIQTDPRAESGYTDDHTQHLHSLQERWKTKLLKPYIRQGTGVSQALSDGVPVYDRGNTQNIGGRSIHTQFEQLTAEIKQRAILSAS